MKTKAKQTQMYRTHESSTKGDIYSYNVYTRNQERSHINNLTLQLGK